MFKKLTFVSRAKVPVSALSLVILARRFSGEEAETAGIVHEACPEGEMMGRAVAAASKLQASRQLLDRTTVSTLKHDLYREAYTALSEGVSYAHTRSKL